jgi:hypothetical protein
MAQQPVLKRIVVIVATASALGACAGHGVTPTTPPLMEARSREPASGTDLVYVSGQSKGGPGRGYVYVYSYPDGKQLGKLTGLFLPTGECVDKTGNVFITNSGGDHIAEYAHGGTKPIALLKDPRVEPSDCAIDSTTGDLAVTNFQSVSDRGGVSIYKGAKGAPIVYSYKNIYYWYNCGYDDKGNLFVDGRDHAGKFRFAELPKSSNAFIAITLDKRLGFPGSVQWDGKYITVEDQSTSKIHRFVMTGKFGTEIGSTALGSATDVVESWITGSAVIGSNSDLKGHYSIRFWRYPGGGQPTKIITGQKVALGVTVSLAQ